MDPLAWLGLKKSSAPAGLAAVHAEVQALLPDDEPVVIRYIVVVAVLLTHVAYADGVVAPDELDHLRVLFRHIDRLPPEEIETLCRTLHEHIPELTDAELEVCFRELKSLCDAEERLQVLRLLASVALANGKIAPSQHGALLKIAQAIGVSEAGLVEVEREVRSGATPPPPGTVSAAREPRCSKEES